MTDYAKIAERIRQMIVNEKVLTHIYQKLQNEGIGWIPVSEKLPEELTYVLVEVNDKRIIARYCRGIWYDHNGTKMRNNVTHWQPLPAPPKEDT